MPISQTVQQAQYRQDLIVKANIISNACDEIDKFFYILQQGILDGSISWKKDPYKHIQFDGELHRKNPYDADTIEEMYTRKIFNFVYFGLLKAQGHYGILRQGKVVKSITIVQQDGRFNLKDLFTDKDPLLVWLPQTNEIALFKDKEILNEVDLSMHMYFVVFGLGYKTVHR